MEEAGNYQKIFLKIHFSFYTVLIFDFVNSQLVFTLTLLLTFALEGLNKRCMATKQECESSLKI